MSYTQWDFPHTHFYETDLRELIAKCNSYDAVINALNQWIESNTPKIEELEQFMKDMQNESTLPESVKQAIFDWCSSHLIDLVGATIKNVFFGLTDDGHFVAYIPDSWSDITFNTTDYDIILTAHPEVDYGHLILSY